MASPSGTRIEATNRSMLRRRSDRGSYDRDLVHAILDEGLVGHVGFSADGSVFVVPTAYARVGDRLYLHGAAANRMLRCVGSGVEACVTVTLLDGLVLSRSAFHHSMNYRSVMVFGRGTRVDDEEEKRQAVLAILEHVAPGRSRDARPPTSSELQATSVVRIPLSEASAKLRSGGPIDDPEDLGREIWAGELPFELTPMKAVPDAGVPERLDAPPYVSDYPRRRRRGP